VACFEAPFTGLVWAPRDTSVVSTSYGDADLNGIVEFSDFLKMSQHFGNAGNWASGDFDGDGFVRFPDFLHLSANFTTNSHSTVPEPTVQCWLLWAALLGIGRFQLVR